MAKAKSNLLWTYSAILALTFAPGWIKSALPDRAAEEPHAREEKSDCEDCVIVLREDSGHPEGSREETAGISGSGVLAGTLWGLFMVARPKRMPRTIIRGVTIT